MVEDFEAFAWGEDWATVQFSPGADPRLSAERQTVYAGEQSCRLDVPPGESLIAVPQCGTGFVGAGGKPPLPLPGTPQRIGLWARGEPATSRTPPGPGGGGHRVWLRLQDAVGKSADVGLGAVSFAGWGYLDAPVPFLVPPVYLSALLVRGGDGPLLLDDITVTTTAAEPLFLSVRNLSRERDLVEGEAARFRVSLQSLAAEVLAGDGELVACEAGSPEVVADRARFRFSVSAAQPFSRVLKLRIPPGVYDVHAQAAGARASEGLVVYPAGPGRAPSASAAIRRFGERGDALRVVESALSPAIVVETPGDKLTFFRGLAQSGLRVPGHLLARVRLGEQRLQEPWVAVWFGAAPEWKGVTFADGSPCPSFDVPFLIVLDQPPTDWKLGDGLELKFRSRGVMAAVMPLLGVRRGDPGETTGWHGTAEAMGELASTCRSWVPLLRAIPVDVREECRVDPERDLVEIRARFSYLEFSGRWGGRPRRIAPVPPLLMLARQAGLPVRFSREPAPTGCYTSVGPYYAIPDAEEYTCSISGLLRFVLSAVADVPPGAPGAQVSLARHYQALSDDAVAVPFWLARGGEAGRDAAEALTRFMLAPSNSRYAYDATSGRMRAWDGLVAQARGDTAAVAYAAEFLQGCWHAGLHAGLWDLLRARWPRIVAGREALAGQGDWATLGLGAREEAADLVLNAEVCFARLAAKLGRAEEFAEGCARAVKLLVAAYALVAGAPRYARELGPWHSPVDGTQKVFGWCRGGSVGLVAGPPPLVTSPSDAGYPFAAELLGPYYRERFKSGPLEFFGRTPAEWSQRLFVAIGCPPAASRFVRLTPQGGEYATNYVFSVSPGEDGWPALRWDSHRSPKGGPLSFGCIAPGSLERAKTPRVHTVGPWLRLSAYAAIEAPPPPKEPSPQAPPKPGATAKEPAAGRPGRSRP